MSEMCLDVEFPADWMQSTLLAPNVIGATILAEFRPNAGSRAMRKVLGYLWLDAVSPIRYDTNQKAIVPKKHAGAGSSLLPRAAEVTREWALCMVVVQLDVRLQASSTFSVALIAWGSKQHDGQIGKRELGSG